MLGSLEGTGTHLRGVVSYPRAIRMEQIEKAIAVDQAMHRRPLSMRQIAHRLNMSASNHLMCMLWDLVDAGRLVADPRPYREGIVAWDFRLVPDRLSAVLADVYDKRSGTVSRI